jgi:hypothetical protein
VAENEPWQELRTDVRTLYGDHLGHALGLLRQSVAHEGGQSSTAHILRSQRYAISAIIHAFCSLESVLNFMAYRMFSIEDGPEFIPEDKRGFFVKSMVNRWDYLKVTEKCNAILSVSQALLLPNEVNSRLSEVGKLRNWIVHGKCYHSTLLVSPSPDPHVLYEVIDEEASKSWKDWEQRFPFYHFNQPLAVNHSDARTVLRVIIETLLILSRGTGFKWFYTTCFPQLSACGLSGDTECDLDGLLGIESTEPSASVDLRPLIQIVGQR